jgi:hypothetical protein
MGNVIANGTKDAHVWNGGQPNIDWTGLEDSNAVRATVNCNRPTKTSDETTAYNRRIAAPDKLFKKDDPDYDLLQFSQAVEQHFLDHGLDSIMYVKSLTDPTKMVNVVADYNQVHLDHVEVQSALNALKYDQYDRDNDKAACRYLESAIHSDLLRELKLHNNVKDSAATTWMRILCAVSDGSVERFNRQKAELKALSPLNEPGENITIYASKVRKICLSLSQANQFEWMLVLTIIKTLCKVSVEIFRSSLNPKQTELDKLLRESCFMTKTVESAFLTGKGFHYDRILTDAEDTYKSLLDNGDWPPALIIMDKQKAPVTFNTSITKAEFNSLVQSTVNKHLKQVNNGTNLTQQKDTLTVECFKCHKLGHYANKCPNDKPSTGMTTATSTMLTMAECVLGKVNW